MPFLANESLIFIIYLKFCIQQYVTWQGLLWVRGWIGKEKGQKIPHPHPKKQHNIEYH